MEEPKLLKKIFWKDANGRRFRTYVVRSLGPGEGFAVLDVCANVLLPILPMHITREQAQEEFGKLTEADLNAQRHILERQHAERLTDDDECSRSQKDPTPEAAPTPQEPDEDDELSQEEKATRAKAQAMYDKFRAERRKAEAAKKAGSERSQR